MNIHLGAPQIMFLLIYIAVDISVFASKGVQVGILSVLLNIPMLGLLYWGGFFG